MQSHLLILNHSPCWWMQLPDNPPTFLFFQAVFLRQGKPVWQGVRPWANGWGARLMKIPGCILKYAIAE